MKSWYSALLTAAALAVPSSAFAQLNSLGPAPATGSGIGSVFTILTLQERGTEAGCIGPTAVSACMLGNAKTGASQTNLFTLGTFPTLTGSNLRLILNFNEPKPATGATLNNATLTVYNGSTSVFNSSSGSVTFANTFSGIGNSGFAFGLSSTDAALFDTILHQSGSSAYTLGLKASLGNVSGGPETFSLASATNVATVPEPGTFALLGTGLIGLAPLARRKRRA